MEILFIISSGPVSLAGFCPHCTLCPMWLLPMLLTLFLIIDFSVVERSHNSSISQCKKLIRYNSLLIAIKAVPHNYHILCYKISGKVVFIISQHFCFITHWYYMYIWIKLQCRVMWLYYLGYPVSRVHLIHCFMFSSYLYCGFPSKIELQGSIQQNI